MSTVVTFRSVLIDNGKRTPHMLQPTGTKQFWPLAFERPIQHEVFYYVVPGGGLEPPRPCGLRILSLFFGVLQSVANERRSQHKPFRYITIHEMLGLQLVAGKCTKVGNEQPSKQPLGRSSDFQFTFDGVLPAFINEVAVLPFNLLEYRHLPTALISVQFRTSEGLSNWWPFSPIW